MNWLNNKDESSGENVAKQERFADNIERLFPSLVDYASQFETKEERDRAVKEQFELAQEIWPLVQLKRANHGILPRGAWKQAAHTLNLSEDQISRRITRLEEHDRARQGSEKVGTRADALQLRQKGRHKGMRDCGKEIEGFIIDSWRNPDWETLNRLRLTDGIHRYLTRRMIHKLAEAKGIKISLRTVYRIIDGFEEKDGAHAAFARGQEHEAIENLTAIDADFGHPNNVWILDILATLCDQLVADVLEEHPAQRAPPASVGEYHASQG